MQAKHSPTFSLLRQIQIIAAAFVTLQIVEKYFSQRKEQWKWNWISELYSCVLTFFFCSFVVIFIANFFLILTFNLKRKTTHQCFKIVSLLKVNRIYPNGTWDFESFLIFQKFVESILTVHVFTLFFFSHSLLLLEPLLI